MNRKLLFVIYLLLGFCPIYAQTSSLAGVKAELNAMFSGLDKTKVPTGYLWDTAINLVEGEYYNGSALTDSNYVTLPLLGDMLYSINSASVGADTISVQAALSRIERNTSIQNAMVGILFQPYNYIVANALTDNLISYSNGIVSDVYNNGVWQNPYGESVLFGYAVGNGGTVSQSVTYSFANVDSLSTLVFSSIQFDPGDGNGFRALSSNGECTLTYQETGYKETKLKMTVGGHIYQGHCLVFVKDSDPYLAPGSSSYVDSLEVSATYEGGTYRARVVHEATVSFNRRPIIVSEGFDPWRLYSDKTIHSYSGFTDINDILSQSFFSNYDVYYVDWNDCGADIRANAEVLKAVICWVNSQNQSGQPNIVLGQSMGGLIARYALRDMELHNEPHNTTLFISHDVPYLGANVSPGLLYTYWDLYDLTENWVVGGFLNIINATKDLVPELKKLGGYTSVKQMLPLYMNSFWNYDPSVFNSFQLILNNYGFPRGDAGETIENVAIINGGKSPSGSNSLYSAGDLIVDAELGVSSGYLTELLLMWIFKINGGSLWPPGKTTLSISHKVYPYLNYNDLVRSTTMTFKKKLLWLNILDKTVNIKSQNAPLSGPKYDAYTSSYYELKNYQDTIGYDAIGHIFWDIQTIDKLAFIPTASGMAMPNEFGRDFLTNKPIPHVDTPFDSYILSGISTEHIDFFPGVSAWLDSVVDDQIVGPDVAFTGDCYCMAGRDSISSITWSTSNSSYATINQSGELVVVNPGLVEVIASINGANSYIAKRKQVLLNLPQMYLTSSSTGNNTYKVEAKISDLNVRKYLREKGLRDSLYFTWSLQMGEESLQTITNRDSTFTVELNDSTYNATVCLTLSLFGHTGETYSIITSRNDYYIWNLREIHKTSSSVTFQRFRPTRFPPEVGVPHFMISKNPAINAGEIPFSHIRVCGHNFYGTEGQYTPFLSNESIDYLSFDIFAEDDVWEMIEDMIPEFAQIMLEIDIYDLSGEIYQKITVPIIYDSSTPLPHV